jgi:CHAT domain-containing protein
MEQARAQPRRQIVGLKGAVLHAGAPGVISTLSVINDEASSELMIALLAGDSAVETLRPAQRAMLERQPHRDPSY